ncbi:MAG TPA: tRNA-binding protein [Pirellulales bacterium]
MTDSNSHGPSTPEPIQPRAAIAFDDFLKVDIRVGRVVEVQPFPAGRHSTHILRIDFGPPLGEKKSLAKLAPNYEGNEIVGRQVLCVVNFPPRQIGKHLSEVLTLGVPDAQGHVVLIRPDAETPLGGRLY